MCSFLIHVMHIFIRDESRIYELGINSITETDLRTITQSYTESIQNAKMTENIINSSEMNHSTEHIQINSTNVANHIQSIEVMYNSTTMSSVGSSKIQRNFDFPISPEAAPKYYIGNSNKWRYFTIILMIVCCLCFVVRIGKKLINNPIFVPYQLDPQESYLRSVELIRHLDFKELRQNLKQF